MSSSLTSPTSRTGAPLRCAIVLTHNRPDLLPLCLDAIAPQADLVLVIDNASNPPAAAPAHLHNVLLVRDNKQPPNLSRLWNRGLDTIAAHLPDDTRTWDVALLCDDTVAPAGWYDTVSSCMREHAAAAASTHSARPLADPIVKTSADSDITNRMCGWAFMLAGELVGERVLRADEAMRWWWCDTDLDWQARAAGGMVLAPGQPVPNLRPNDFTYNVPGLAEQAARDREAFAAKWGSAPW